VGKTAQGGTEVADTHKLQPGQLVYSCAGRDSQKPFIVTRVIDERYVEIADGDLRSVDKPKRKNIKHIRATGRFADALHEKLVSEKPVENRELREAIGWLLEGAPR
jgi:ribosomal protein L14E/L6E/L27E